jgi:hypothetical protein
MIQDLRSTTPAVRDPRSNDNQEEEEAKIRDLGLKIVLY